MTVRRALLACGILSPALYLASDVIASARYPGYSWPHQTLSELNAFGAPSRPVTVVLGIALYAALGAFGVGLWRETADARLRTAAAALVAMGVFSVWAVPFASMAVRGAEQGPLHLVSGAVAIPLLLLAMGFAAAALGRGFRLYTVASALALLAFGAWAGIEGPRIAGGLATPWVGVKERASVYAYQLWILVLAVTLLGRRRRRSPLPPDAASASPGRP